MKVDNDVFHLRINYNIDNYQHFNIM